MIVADLPDGEVSDRLAGAGLRLATGPVVSVIRSGIPAVAAGISLLYAQHAVTTPDGFADFHVELVPSTGLRRLFRPQVFFHFDGNASFNPLPFDQAFPMLEWGLNWCISSHCHQYLIIHAGVVARGERAVILPAPPGSGKSTLCAALMLHGWRLLSDELALIDPATGRVWPIPRPVSLKNASIDIIRRASLDAVISLPVHDTLKGTVAHLKPTLASVSASGQSARPVCVVFPRYHADAPAALTSVPKAEAFMRIVDNAFNYDIHGRRGFDVVANLIDDCDCYNFPYASLGAALATLDNL